jgi:hypothetical protein
MTYCAFNHEKQHPELIEKYNKFVILSFFAVEEPFCEIVK